MERFVLDSSVLIAYLEGEPGAQVAALLGPHGLISTVNLAEVYSRAADRGEGPGMIEHALEYLTLEVVVFDSAQSLAAGLLRPLTRHRGLSLGDRACLALAQARGLPVLTADRAWADLALGVEVRLLRD